MHKHGDKYSHDFPQHSIQNCDDVVLSHYTGTAVTSLLPYNAAFFFFFLVTTEVNNTVLKYQQQETHSSQFVVSDGTGVHKGLGDDGQDGVHMVWVLHVKDELWVLEDIDPEPQR